MPIDQRTQHQALVAPADLIFFSTLSGCGSLSAAARELGVTTAAVSKRLTSMEGRLRQPLVIRTTRRMSLTPEGEVVLDHARRVLAEIEHLEDVLGGEQAQLRGLLRVNATLGFGRSHVGPVISHFAREHPQVEVQLQVSVHPPPLTDDSWDVCIRFGPPPDSRAIAKLLARNQRLLVAAPSYLAKHGKPKSPADLIHHNCIGIRQ